MQLNSREREGKRENPNAARASLNLVEFEEKERETQSISPHRSGTTGEVTPRNSERQLND